VQLSLGVVSQSEQRVSEALANPVAEAHEEARKAPVKHIDETGWVQAAARRSLWTIATITGCDEACAIIADRCAGGSPDCEGECAENKWNIDQAQMDQALVCLRSTASCSEATACAETNDVSTGEIPSG
jgi:hypothetical protein